MKYAAYLLLFLSFALSVAFAKDPAIERRKEACHKISMYLEQNTGWYACVRIAPGKAQDESFPNGVWDIPIE